MSIRKGPITTKEIDNATPYLSDIKGFQFNALVSVFALQVTMLFL